MNENERNEIEDAVADYAYAKVLFATANSKERVMAQKAIKTSWARLMKILDRIQEGASKLHEEELFGENF